MIEPFGRGAFEEQSYEVREMNGTEIIYKESYSSSVDKEEFQSFYLSKYNVAENFVVDEDEYGLSYQWTDRGFTCQASISTYGGSSGESVTIIATKKI